MYGKKMNLLLLLLAGIFLTGCRGISVTEEKTVASMEYEAGNEITTASEENEKDALEEAEKRMETVTEYGAETEEETRTDSGTNAEDPADAVEKYLTADGYLDLKKLQKINSDIYAWIDIEGTGLSFPLLQSEEDETFYLTHDENRNPDDGGCIYTEYFNRKDFSDPNTVIYGRNVNGRFAGLHQFQDRDFFDSHRSIKIYLEDKVLQYRIFAAYTYDDRHLIKIYDFWDKDIFAAYLNDVFSQRAMEAYLDDSIPVTADDHIITLSTGVTGADDRRYLVQAVQLSELK